MYPIFLAPPGGIWLAKAPGVARFSARSAAALGALLLVVTSAGCTPTEWYPVRIAAPAGATYREDLATNQCAHACYEDAGTDSSRFYDCLALCPGIVTAESTTCEDPAPGPEAFCYTRWVEREREVESGGGGGDTAFRIFGAILQGLFESALRSSERGPDRRELGRREREESHPRAAERPSRRSDRGDAAREERSRPSAPRRHTPARPRLR